MRTFPARFVSESVEAETRQLWAGLHLPPPEAPTSPAPGGAAVHLAAALSTSEGVLAALLRAVRADAGARRSLSEGRRILSPLVLRAGERSPEDLGPLLAKLGLWVGGGEARSAESLAPTARLARAMATLAELGVLGAREGPMLCCPTCRTPRTPQTVLYETRSAPSYLVRYRLEGEPAGASLLVWTDALWKLLGSPVVAVHPGRPYVAVRVRDRDAEELLWVERSALSRLWGGPVRPAPEVLEERPGSDLAGRRYRHPLETEFPALAELPAPGGTIVASEEIVEEGSGAVAIAPSHGPRDFTVAEAARVSAGPVVNTKGELVGGLTHKYVGLPVDMAEAFLLRDLGESGALFRQTEGEHGLPVCTLCGGALLWAPGRAWCLDPTRLPGALGGLLERLRPPGVPSPFHPSIPWPASDVDERAPADHAVELSECPDCGRLAAPPGPASCPCGGTPRPERHRLLPAFVEAVSQWVALAPLPPGTEVHLYLPERSLGPALVHQVVAMAAVGAAPGEARLTPLPTVAGGEELSALLEGAQDGLRATLLRIAQSPRGGPAGLLARRREEERRLHKLWEVCREVLAAAAGEATVRPSGTDRPALAELAVEDRALLSRFDGVEAEVRDSWARSDIPSVHARLWAFLENDLRGAYLPWVRDRLGPASPPEARRVVLRLLGYLLERWTRLYAPIGPFTMEALHQALGVEGTSLFEGSPAEPAIPAPDAHLDAAFALWRTVPKALGPARRELGLADDVGLLSIVLAPRDEAAAETLRTSAEVVARISGVAEVTISSPSRPWDGRVVSVRPVPEEIQRAYPAQPRRIVHLLEGMNGRKVREALAAGTLRVALEGHTLPILPSMVEVTEELPDDVVPVGWPLGELLLRLPQDHGASATLRAPLTTPDGLRFSRELRRRLEGSAAPSAVDRVVVVAKGALAADLARGAPALSEWLGGREVELAGPEASFPDDETLTGRSGRGERWHVWAPGLAVRARAKTTRRRTRAPRLRPLAALSSEIDAMALEDQSRQLRSESVRRTVERFDRELGRPLLGPAKAGAAWEAGLRSFEEIASAPYEQLSAIPGFGGAVAAEIVRHFGGDVPERPLAPPPAPAPRPSQGPPASVPAVAVAPTPGPADPPRAPAPPIALAAPVAPTIALAALVAPTIPSPPAVTPPSVVTVERPAPTLVPEPRIAPPASADAPGPVPPPTAATVLATASGPAPGLEVCPGASADDAWSSFLETTGAGHRGLCISREFPDRLRAYLGARDVDVYWLSNAGRDGSVRPSDLDGLLALLRRVLKERNVTAVYLEGVEYLVRIHGLAKTRRFLEELEAELRVRDARAWLPLNPTLLDPASSTELESSFRREPRPRAAGASEPGP